MCCQGKGRAFGKARPPGLFFRCFAPPVGVYLLAQHGEQPAVALAGLLPAFQLLQARVD